MKTILLIAILMGQWGCVAQNERDQQSADRNYMECARAAAQSLALSSNLPADRVAATAARSCPAYLRMVEGSRALPLGANEAAAFADNFAQETAKTLVADVEQARRSAPNR
jgi:hypothetical protein